ncbi:hypothetical protein Dip518_000305 [Parelusimicrobium proximum]|uniref:hypothetical protein n=1 Tax=Parelusimicrobium proximum TaxID=3228953 RepID=UPI003D17663A
MKKIILSFALVLAFAVSAFAGPGSVIASGGKLVLRGKGAVSFARGISGGGAGAVVAALEKGQTVIIDGRTARANGALIENFSITNFPVLQKQALDASSGLKPDNGAALKQLGLAGSGAKISLHIKEKIDAAERAAAKRPVAEIVEEAEEKYLQIKADHEKKLLDSGPVESDDGNILFYGGDLNDYRKLSDNFFYELYEKGNLSAAQRDALTKYKKVRELFDLEYETDYHNIKAMLGRRPRAVINMYGSDLFRPEFYLFQKGMLAVNIGGYADGVSVEDLASAFNKLSLLIDKNPVIHLFAHGDIFKIGGEFQLFLGDRAVSMGTIVKSINDNKPAGSKPVLIMDNCHGSCGIDEIMQMSPAERGGVNYIASAGMSEAQVIFWPNTRFAGWNYNMSYENNYIRTALSEGKAGLTYIKDGVRYSPLEEAVKRAEKIKDSGAGFNYKGENISGEKLYSELVTLKEIYNTNPRKEGKKFWKAIDNAPEGIKILRSENDMMTEAAEGEKLRRMAITGLTESQMRLQTSYGKRNADKISYKKYGILFPDYIAEFVLDTFKGMPKF